MANPFQRYIQLLIPLVTDKGGCGTSTDGVVAESPRGPLSEMIISILSDNARPLRREDSMTMRSLQKQTDVKMCRWSSVPNLIQLSPSASSSSISGTPRRSIDDLTRLMLNNSRLPRSTDDLRRRSTDQPALAGPSPRRWSDGMQDTAPQRNGSWDVRKKSISKEENPFFLRMPSRRVNATNEAPTEQQAFLEPRGMRLKASPKTLSMKIPERQVSHEEKREDNIMVDSKRDMRLLLKNLKEGAMKIPERRDSADAKRGDNTMMDSKSPMQLLLKNLREAGMEAKRDPQAVTERRTSP
jgi:hypothetical protein